MVLFPAPGGPVRPIRRARPRLGCIAPSSASEPGRWFSTMLIARASAAFRPVRKSARRASCTSALVARRGLVVLVADVPDELLEQVLERHETHGALLLVLHQRKVLTTPQHTEQQLAAGRRIGRERDGAKRWKSLASHLQHVERVHH